MFLFPFTSDWVFMSEDEVDFVGRTAFIRTEHDSERGLVLSASSLHAEVAHRFSVRVG